MLYVLTSMWRTYTLLLVFSVTHLYKEHEYDKNIERYIFPNLCV